MLDIKICFAKCTGGASYEYLKDITLVGSVGGFSGGSDFVVFGCVDSDQAKFYEGIYQMDKAEPFIGLESIEETKEFWEEGSEGLTYIIDAGCFEVFETNEVKP